MPITDKPQFHRGKKVEAFLDEFFRHQGYVIEPTTPHEERVLCRGDRKFRQGDQVVYVEYKSGLQSFYTKNIFLETISVDTQHKPGWVYTCNADMIFYAALLNHKILVFKPERLRSAVEHLRTTFREVATSKNQNDGYNTHGLLVPLDYAEKLLADGVIYV